MKNHRKRKRSWSRRGEVGNRSPLIQKKRNSGAKVDSKERELKSKRTKKRERGVEEGAWEEEEAAREK